MQVTLNERFLQDPIEALLRAMAPAKWVVREWIKVRQLSFSELSHETVNEPSWPADAINKAHAFFVDVERDYVMLHIGERSCVVSREFAARLKSLV